MMLKKRAKNSPFQSCSVSCLPSQLYLLHLCLSARCGGTVGAILTCPLEVVKTRLQSSSITLYVSEVQLSTVNGASVARMSPPGPLHCLKWVLNIIYHRLLPALTYSVYFACIALKWVHVFMYKVHGSSSLLSQRDLAAESWFLPRQAPCCRCCCLVWLMFPWQGQQLPETLLHNLILCKNHIYQSF